MADGTPVAPVMSSPFRVSQPRDITSPRTPDAVSPCVAQFESQLTRSIENIAAASSSCLPRPAV